MRKRALVVLLPAKSLAWPGFAQTSKKKPATSAPAPAATPAVKLQGLDDLAADAMKQWKVPGLAIAVVQDGKVIYAKGYGYRDRDLGNKLPVTTATLFPIGSITKSFTALTFAIFRKTPAAKSLRSFSISRTVSFTPNASSQTR